MGVAETPGIQSWLETRLQDVCALVHTVVYEELNILMALIFFIEGVVG